jgi:hypothetical protein
VAASDHPAERRTGVVDGGGWEALSPPAARAPAAAAATALDRCTCGLRAHRGRRAATPHMRGGLPPAHQQLRQRARRLRLLARPLQAARATRTTFIGILSQPLNEERPSAGACGAVSPSRVPNVYETRRNRTTLRETRPRDEHKARREGRAAAAHARAAAALSRQGGVGSAHEPGITASEGRPHDGGRTSAVHRGTCRGRAQHSRQWRGRALESSMPPGALPCQSVFEGVLGKRDRGEAGLDATQPLVRARKNRALLSQPLPSVGAGGHRRGKGRVGSF